MLYVIIPKGFFPTQDTGIIIGITDAAQDISYDEMSRLQQQVNDLVLQDPAVASVVASIGAGTAARPPTMGGCTSRLKPWGERSDDVMQVDRPAGSERWHPCRASGCSSNRPRMSASARGSAARSINTHCRIRTRMS